VSNCVGRSVIVNPEKTAEPIEMPFGLKTRVGPGNYVLHWGPDPSMGGGIFEGGRDDPLRSIGTLYGHLCDNG